MQAGDIQEPRTRPAGDLLADALEVLRLRSCLWGCLDLKAPWGIELTGPVGWFHLVRTACVVQVDPNRGVPAAPGDFLIVGPGNQHRLTSEPDEKCIPFSELRRDFRLDSAMTYSTAAATPCTVLVSGTFLLEGLDRSPLQACLPELIHLEGSSGRPPAFVEYILHLMVQEATAKEACAQMILDRLFRILLLKSMQRHLATACMDGANWLRAITDPDIGRALANMHDQPHEPWTVASLAESVVMSRSAFSARFTALVGRPPLEYLFTWRMHKASHLLRTSRSELKEVAAKVGYDSPSAFGKAFARWAGMAPGIYRNVMRTAAASTEDPCTFECKEV